MNLSGPAEKDEKFSEPHGRVLEIMNVEIVRVVVTTFQSHRDQSSRAEVVPPSVLITHKSAARRTALPLKHTNLNIVERLQRFG
ncbi:hypothetical protein RRG08_014521 [Elysia crispata]|uniref:Uncharacterized protein n=1 Tax=Elysia crispata TaxID=231223 RepID=A0AAE1AVR0_9GAST|nr:hypothetical protein RRG08_014521 [Elysia crispata]